jgi:hypothetical protein
MILIGDYSDIRDGSSLLLGMGSSLPLWAQLPGTNPPIFCDDRPSKIMKNHSRPHGSPPTFAPVIAASPPANTIG